MNDVSPDARAWIGALESRSSSRLAPAEVAAITGLRMRRVELAPDAHFFWEGDPVGRCGYIVEGALHQTKLTCGGARQIVGIRLPNEFVGLQHLLLETNDHNLQALTRSRLIEVCSTQLLSIIRDHPRLGSIIMADAMISCSIAQDWIVNVGRRDAPSRVAHLLCELALRIQGSTLAPGASYVLPLTQTQLGDAVGLGRVAVNRTIRDLAQAGLVACNKSHITILNAQKLAEIGDFSARYLHLGQSGRDRRREPRAFAAPALSTAA